MFECCSNKRFIVEDFENLFKKKDNFPEKFDNAVKYKNGIIFIYDTDNNSLSHLYSKLIKDEILLENVNNNFTILIAKINEKDKFTDYLQYELIIEEGIYFIIKKQDKYTNFKCKMDINCFKEGVNKCLDKIENEKKRIKLDETIKDSYNIFINEENIDNQNNLINNNNDSLGNNYFQNYQLLNDNLTNSSYTKKDIYFQNNNINLKISNFHGSNQEFNNNYNSFQNDSLYQSNNEQNRNKISNLNQNAINLNNKASFLNNNNISNYQNDKLLDNTSINFLDIKIKENYQPNNFEEKGSYNSELYYNELIKNNNFNHSKKKNSNYSNNNINNGFSKENNNITTIVFRFPSSKSVKKTFYIYDRIELMFDFINSLGDEIFKELKQKTFIFSQPFPNKFFTLREKEQTFYEAKLCPEGTLDIIPDKKSRF